MFDGRLVASVLSDGSAVLRMRQVNVYGSACAARCTLEFEMFKHVFLTGPPGKRFLQVSLCFI